jgi:hypothetical protein
VSMRMGRGGIAAQRNELVGDDGIEPPTSCV